jgi:hypothetical protein
MILPWQNALNTASPYLEELHKQRKILNFTPYYIIQSWEERLNLERLEK